MKINLMYHDISICSDMSSGFQTKVSMPYKVDIIEFENHVKACVGSDVVFTFDDGGSSFYTAAAPILEKYGFHGIFFISTAFIGMPGFLTEEQIKVLDGHEHIIGTHTHNHLRDLSSCDKKTIEYEWNTSVDVLSHILKKRITYASLPNGNGSEFMYETISKAGIKRLYTSKPTTRVRHRYGMEIIGRYTVLRTMSTLSVVRVVQSRFKRFLLVGRWLIVFVVKRVLGTNYYKLRKFIASH